MVLEDAGKEQGEQADERVHMDFLVRPVVLGPQRQMFVVLELAKDFFDLALSTVGEQDLFGRPRVAVGGDDAFAEDFCFKV